MLVFFFTSDHVSLPCGVFLFPAYHVGCFYSRSAFAYISDVFTMWGVFIPKMRFAYISDVFTMWGVFIPKRPCGVFLFPKCFCLYFQRFYHVGCFCSRETMCLTMWGVFIPAPGTMCLTMWGVFIPGSPCGL